MIHFKKSPSIEYRNNGNAAPFFQGKYLFLLNWNKKNMGIEYKGSEVWKYAGIFSSLECQKDTNWRYWDLGIIKLLTGDHMTFKHLLMSSFHFRYCMFGILSCSQLFLYKYYIYNSFEPRFQLVSLYVFVFMWMIMYIVISWSINRRSSISKPVFTIMTHRIHGRWS